MADAAPAAAAALAERLARLRTAVHHARVGVGTAEPVIDAAPPQRAQGDWRLRALAVAVTVAALAASTGALVLQQVYAGRGLALSSPILGDLVLGSMFPVAGLVVLWRQPRNACGWVLLSAGLVGVSALAHTWVQAVAADPGSLPLLPAAVWFSSWTYVPYWVQSSLLPVLFPDGRLPSARWRVYVRAVLTLVALLTVVAMFKPDQDVEDLGFANPLGWFSGPIPSAVWQGAQLVCVLTLFVVATPIALGGMVLRLRRSTGRERAQLQWLLLGLVCLPAWGLLSQVIPFLAAEGGFALAFACIPLSLGIAVVRHSLLDIEVVVNRTVVYALLTGAGVLAYVGLVALASSYAGSNRAGPVLAALVVAAAAAGRTRVQSLVDRRLFGSRRDPYAVVQQVGASTAAATAPGEALAALVVAVRGALRLPFVQVLDAEGEVAAESGAPALGTHVIPIIDHGRQLGNLVVGRRSLRERLRTEEASALVDVAHRAGALLTARQLMSDLQESYAQVLRVREEERRRLRRDLHDGIGPSLAGIALQLDGLADRLSDDPVLSGRATRARDRLLTTVGEVRRIVDGLRPAAVEDLGLEAALGTLATDVGDRVQVRIEVDLPTPLPPLVEVAVYRIAGEAVTNVLRHAQATQAVVRARLVGDEVHVEVTDDGCGFTTASPGVGLRSMADRTREVGGRLEVSSEPGHGTRILAVLPSSPA